MTESEKNYAQIERELLAIVFALEKFHTYVYGRNNVVVITDHKPLVAIHKKALASAPKRLQRMLLRLQRYSYQIEYKPGSNLLVSDTLSRAVPTDATPPTDFHDLASIEHADSQQLDELQMIASPETLDLINNAASVDAEYQQLVSQIQAGWPPSKAEIRDPSLRQYYTFADELTVCGGLVFKGSRLVVPQPARATVLKRLHRAHIGVNAILRRARDIVYYPGLATDIKRLTERCDVCARFQQETQREPLLCHTTPQRPWEKLGVDIFMFSDHDYLITVDYLSGFFEADKLPSKAIRDITYCLKQHFARHGLPLVVVTDNSPFAAREFQQFAKKYHFSHVTSSPRYPTANGKVENAVKTMKGLMKKARESGEDIFLSLLDWRNTPSDHVTKSPSQILFNRRTRTSLPTTPSVLLDSVSAKAAQIALTAAKQKQAYHDRFAKAKPQFTVAKQ